ncbi:MAG: Small heat shock protein [Ramlibacter sp.]|nr:Small heat shock protein [Ramlibacter sp.]
MARGQLSSYGGQNSDPFLMLRREMERLFDNVAGSPSQSTGRGDGVIAPRMDISEDEKEIKVVAEMPGASPDKVEVVIDGDVLTIRGERTQERETNRKNYHLVERSVGMFQRSLHLPSEVEASQVDARLDNGVLTITIPKSAAQQRARRVQVQGGAGKGTGQQGGEPAADDSQDKGAGAHH